MLRAITIHMAISGLLGVFVCVFTDWSYFAGKIDEIVMRRLVHVGVQTIAGRRIKGTGCAIHISIGAKSRLFPRRVFEKFGRTSGMVVVVGAYGVGVDKNHHSNSHCFWHFVVLPALDDPAAQRFRMQYVLSGHHHQRWRQSRQCATLRRCTHPYIGDGASHPGDHVRHNAT